MEELLTLSLLDLRDRLRAREASAAELMEAVLARIDATHADLNAFTFLRDREALLEGARAADDRIGRGEARALEGIPLGVKELEQVAGLPHTEGCVVHRDRMGERDEVHVQRLRAAGAIVVGKTNVPEFGYTALTKNLIYGTTRSPWNLEHTPGGSSGGSSAALAACVCPLVTASDGGGSIRIPASFTGAFGLKVSQGRVPRGPYAHWDHQDTSVYGPLTKTVADGALYLDVVAGPAPEDPGSLPPPGLSYLEVLEDALPAGTTFGFSPDLGYAAVQSDVAARVEEAAQTFAKLGHRLVPIDDGPPVMGREWGMLGAFDHLGSLDPFLPEREDDFGRTFLAGIRAGAQMTPVVFEKIRRQRAELNAWAGTVFERCDFLITPTVPYDPPPAKGPFPEETEGKRQPPAGVAAFTIPWNLAWHPAATVRAGLSDRGLPIGMQIVGPRHRDDLVLRAARAFERERPWHPEWPTGWAALGR